MNNGNLGERVFTGQLLSENDVITLADLCRSCAVEVETITTLVAEGVLDPMDDEAGQWTFTIASLPRVKTVIHLQRDLGVNLAGAALALELLDRISELERF